jgi:pimeloyl-ACP methyl ester carboxylesterase
MPEIVHLPTVLIHGFAFDHRLWYPVELAFEGHHVVYLSLPGFGMEREIKEYSIESLAAKYWDHLEEVLGQPVHLVGHSMGGYVAAEMLAQKPDRVVSLALVHSHVFADAPEKKQGRLNAMKDIMDNGKEAFVKKLIPGLLADSTGSREIIDQLLKRGMQYDDSAWYHGLQAMAGRADHTETLKNCKVPVLLLMGENDSSVPVENAYRQSGFAERTTLHVYKDCGHLGMYEKTPEMVRDLVRFYAQFA